MDNQRLFLWLGLIFLVWLNVDAWMRDYSTPEPTAPAAVTAPAQEASSLANTLPSVAPAAPPAATTVPTPAATSAATSEVPAPVAAAAPGADPAATPAVATPAAPAAQAVRIVTDVLDLEISTQGGEFRRADVLQYPLRKGDPNTPVRLFNATPGAALFLLQSGLTAGKGGAEPNHLALFTAPAAELRLAPNQDELRVPLTWSDGAGLTVTKTYVFRRGSYAVDLFYDVQNAGTEPAQLTSYVQLLRHWEPVKRSMWDVESYAFKGPAIFNGESYQKLDVEDEQDAAYTEAVKDGWIAGLQHHFVAAAVPQKGQPYQFSMKVEDKDFLLRAVGPAQAVPANGTLRISEKLFVGPKLQEQLKATGPRLELVADYGMLTFLAQPLFWVLETVHDFVGNWGWTIIIVTLLIKLVFYKLAETSGRSMAKMRTVAPRIKAMQDRYKDDREQQARALMELYKKEKINPVAGCLPMLVQIPFFLAFYWVLLESVELRQAPFMLWMQDLSSRDPYFILPLLMGAAMYGQFKLNPQPPDPIQAKIFAFMPVVMTVMFAFFPSGLVLYWLTNTVLSIAQQWKINRVVEAEEKKRKTS